MLNYLLLVESLGGQFVSIDELVKSSDFIILTSVLSPETKFTINKDRLSSMKSNAVIINVGRGGKLNYTHIHFSLILNLINK